VYWVRIQEDLSTGVTISPADVACHCRERETERHRGVLKQHKYSNTYIIVLCAVIISCITTANIETPGVQAQPQIRSWNWTCVTERLCLQQITMLSHRSQHSALQMLSAVAVKSISAAMSQNGVQLWWKSSKMSSQFGTHHYGSQIISSTDSHSMNQCTMFCSGKSWFLNWHRLACWLGTIWKICWLDLRNDNWIKCLLIKQCLFNCVKFTHMFNKTYRLLKDFVTGKFDHGLSHLLHEELHWLEVPECIQYKLGVTVHRCLQNKATTSLRHSQPTSFTISHLTSPDCTMLPAQHFQSSGLLCRRSDGLELATRQSPWPGAQQQQLQTIAEDEPISSLPLSTHSAVEMLHDSVLYKSISTSCLCIWSLNLQFNVDFNYSVMSIKLFV